MRRIAIAAAVALTAIGALPTASAQTNTFTVDCNRGQNIARALELGDFRKPLVVNVRGTCTEFVTITRANVNRPTGTLYSSDIRPTGNCTSVTRSCRWAEKYIAVSSALNAVGSMNGSLPR